MNGQRAPSGPRPEPYQLTERDLEMLRFEGQWWKYAGAKEDAIRQQFGMSATRYYQILNVLIEHDEALAAEPMIVKRLRRLRDDRRRRRVSG
jgi:hypothetical protein